MAFSREKRGGEHELEGGHDIMAKVGCGLFVILAITRMSSCIEGAASSYSGLFVFGDSYVDTGNHEQNMASWRAPYGITWPGYPSGRFSDGLVFTDFYASFLNLTSPTPYRVIKSTLNSTSDEENVLQSSTATGINFGYGGSGVGPTFGANIPTINEQIKEIKQLIEEYVVSTEIVKSSIVLLVVAGNDYGAFLQNHSDLENCSAPSPDVGHLSNTQWPLTGLSANHRFPNQLLESNPADDTSTPVI
ncbi:hypothetical protein GOP47_0012569 [Adiantum capillus-veneris]|uniref:GDSL esterase/lipase n=1 Tax=Adiantum capillus-veneris TaxID=13818 RepID=A0A9D4UQY1_ADICA|nr:hypothetical protein GOP47_0012569 [Adiantum capillus-veneris]